MNTISDAYLTLTAFGAAEDIGKSAFLLAQDGRKVLLDAGLQIFPRRQHKKSIGPKELLKIADQIDIVLLSHGHLDHVGYLPALVRAGFSGRIICTEPTVDIITLLWMDHLKIEGDSHFTLKDIKNTISKIETVKYNQKIKILPGVYVEFFDAGHILGSAMVVIDWEGLLLMYTGDVNDQVTPFHEKYRLPEEPIDILLTETTNGQRNIPKRENVVKELVKKIKETQKKKGRVFIPSFALGRSQEIQFYLMDNLNGFLSSYPLYIDGMILKMNKIYEKYFTPDWVSQKAIQKVADRNSKPFSHSDLYKVNRDSINGNIELFRKNLVTNKKKQIILSTSGMLEGGPIHSYLRYQKSQSDSLFLVGYQAKDTIGYDIKNGQRKFDLVTPWGEKVHFNLKLKVSNFQFSGHASLEGLIRLGRDSGASRIFSIHGAKDSQNAYADIMAKTSGITVENLSLFQPIKLV